MITFCLIDSAGFMKVFILHLIQMYVHLRKCLYIYVLEKKTKIFINIIDFIIFLHCMQHLMPWSHGIRAVVA